MITALLDVSKEWWIEHDAVKHWAAKGKVSRIARDYVMEQWLDVEFPSRLFTIFPERPIAISDIRVKTTGHMHCLNGIKYFFLIERC